MISLAGDSTSQVTLNYYVGMIDFHRTHSELFDLLRVTCEKQHFPHLTLNGEAYHPKKGNHQYNPPFISEDRGYQWKFNFVAPFRIPSPRYEGDNPLGRVIYDPILGPFIKQGQAILVISQNVPCLYIQVMGPTKFLFPHNEVEAYQEEPHDDRILLRSRARLDLGISEYSMPWDSITPLSPVFDHIEKHVSYTYCDSALHLWFGVPDGFRAFLSELQSDYCRNHWQVSRAESTSGDFALLSSPKIGDRDTVWQYHHLNDLPSHPDCTVIDNAV